MGVNLTRLTLRGSMCVLLQPWPCRLAPRSGSCPSHPPPIPCFSGGSPSPLWGSAPMASPGGPILGASSSPRPRGCGHRGHPQHPTMERCVFGCCFAPCLRSPFFPTQNPPVLPWVLISPGPSTSPYPVVVAKYDVTAEHPVDVQVHLHDVPGGDQGLLLHFLRENRGGGAHSPPPPPSSPYITPSLFPRVRSLYVLPPFLIFPTQFFYLRPSFFWFCFFSQTVVPKIANLRNHREADTDANTRGFIYKL